MNETYYKPLEKEFMQSGFRLRELQREGMVALYHKVGIKGTRHPVNFDAGFEVVVITNQNQYEIAGVTVEAKEAYPGNETWGSKGFTYNNLYAAQCKMDSLLGKQKIIPIETESDESPESSVNTTLIVPDNTFSIKDIATANNVEYITGSLAVKEFVAAGTVKLVGTERRNPKGPMTNIYSKV